MPPIVRWFLRLTATNPIAVRLVQNGSRRTKHLYIRAAYLAVLIVVLLWSLLLGTSAGQLEYQKLAAAGAFSFTVIAYLQIGLICVLAPVFMGGAIAQEASPRTWEVLLTTPLTASEIVFGNLLGRLFFVLALLFASLPLFALTQYFGGVPGRAIFASYAVAGCAALLVGSIAIALSVSRLVGKRAFFVFYVCVVSYLGLTLAADVALRQRGLGEGTGQGVTMMTGLNPFLALHALLNPTTYPAAVEGTHSGLKAWMLETPVKFWCFASGLLSLLALVSSTFTVRAGGLQTLGQGDDGVPWTQRLFGRKVVGSGDGDGAVHRAPRTVWHNPIAWREAASRNSTPSKIFARWLFLIMGLGFGVGIVWFYHTNKLTHADFRFALIATVIIELAVISLVAINTAATAISKEREDGTLDLLLTTPLTAGSYLTGKLRGLVTYLLPLLAVPLGTLAIAAMYVAVGGFGRAGGLDVSTTAGGVNISVPVMLIESAVLLPIVVIPFMAFCVMVGLQWSLKSKGTLSSVIATVGVVGAIAGVAGLCGWNAASGIPVLGPVIACLSPASALFSMLYPEDALAQTISSTGGIGSARVALFVGALVSAIVHAGICYGIHNHMVRTFDMTVRKLAGNK
jgi:ABC-type transport system involved in multi-copper enzyme maturation permease subunit